MSKGYSNDRPRPAIHGIVVSLNTPFDSRNAIDFDSMGRLINLHLTEGATGFLTTAQAGEVYELSVAERIELIQYVRSATQGRATVIAGASALQLRESFEVAEAAIGAGCEGVLIEAPAAHRHDREAMLAFVQSFSRLGMPALMLQDLDWSGQGMDVSLIAELFAAIETFHWLKVEVSPCGPKYTAVLEVTNGKLQVSGGWASLQMIEALDRGVSAFMPTAMTRLFARAFEAHRRGDRQSAMRWHQLTLPVLAFTRQHLDVSIHFHKQLFHRLGIFTTPAVRKRTLPYDSFQQRCGNELIDYLEHVACILDP